MDRDNGDRGPLLTMGMGLIALCFGMIFSMIARLLDRERRFGNWRD